GAGRASGGVSLSRGGWAAGGGGGSPVSPGLAGRRLGRWAGWRGALVRASPDIPAARAALAATLRQLGPAYRDIGRPAAAEAALVEAKGLLTRLHRQYPELPKYLSELAEVQNSLGVFYESEGRLDEAERNYLEALRLPDHL